MLLQVVQRQQTQAIQIYGLPSDGVPLQRNLSRVPYNQAAINDIVIKQLDTPVLLGSRDYS